MPLIRVCVRGSRQRAGARRTGWVRALQGNQ